MWSVADLRIQRQPVGATVATVFFEETLAEVGELAFAEAAHFEKCVA